MTSLIKQGIIICGEASESDEEIYSDPLIKQGNCNATTPSSTTNTIREEELKKSSIPIKKSPKYMQDSLLQIKLRESKNKLKESVHATYLLPLVNSKLKLNDIQKSSNQLSSVLENTKSSLIHIETNLKNLSMNIDCLPSNLVSLK